MTYFTPICDEDGGLVAAQKYDILLADPPWPYYGDPDKDAAAGKHYDLMSMEDLCAMPVKSILNKDAAVFVWATCPRLDYGIDLIRGWGLHFRGVAWVWAKTRKDGELIHGQGVPPTFTKPTTELLLAASTRPRGRPFKIQTSAMAQVIEEPFDGPLEPHPREQHSEKPIRFIELIDELAGPDPSRMEMFCRGRPEPNWHGWGNQLDLQPDHALSMTELFGIS